MVTNVKIRWEGTSLIVESDEGKELRFERAYIKDPPYPPREDRMEPVPICEVESVLRRCTFKLGGND